MQQFILENEEVNNFRYKKAFSDGITTRELVLEYSSPLLTEMVKVIFFRGACGEKQLYFKTFSDNIRLDVTPDFVTFCNQNVRARFTLTNHFYLVLEFHVDEDMGTPYFTIMLEEY